MSEVLYVMKIRLPDSSTSGGSDSSTSAPLSRNDAIRYALPKGFEVDYSHPVDEWATDKRGLTYVPLLVKHNADALLYCQQQANGLRSKLQQLKRLL